jgi:hypothetical protein
MISLPLSAFLFPAKINVPFAGMVALAEYRLDGLAIVFAGLLDATKANFNAEAV